MHAFHFPHLFSILPQGGPHYFLHYPKLAYSFESHIIIKITSQHPNLGFFLIILFYDILIIETQMVWAT